MARSKDAQCERHNCHTPDVAWPAYQFPTKLRAAVFRARLNRFLAEIQIGGEKALAHIPHTGRLPELLVRGRRCYLAPALHSERRKTKWTLTLIEDENGGLGCIDTSVPNRLIRMMAQRERIPGLEGWKYMAHEVSVENSRIDLVLQKGSRKILIEVKSVTWVVEGHALFPDAPTLRGIKHLNALLMAKRAGYDAAMIFVIQRSDALYVRIASFIDDRYLETALQAQRTGVRFLAVRCGVSLTAVKIDKPVPIQLRPPPVWLVDRIKRAHAQS